MTIEFNTPTLRDHLSGAGPLRVWSLIVTILGDAVELRGGEIPTARLTLILERLGVSQAAQRTALSRLVQDGWVERRKGERDGRASIYRFTSKGREEFGPAARLIYAAPGTVSEGNWVATTSADPRGIPMAPGVGLWPADFAPRDAGAFRLVGLILEGDGPDMPQVSAAQEADMTALRRYLGTIEAAGDDIEGGAALAARITLIHLWRRYVLRYPEWPRVLVADTWPGTFLREEVAEAYMALRKPSDQWLSSDVEGVPEMPPPLPDHHNRFVWSSGRQKIGYKNSLNRDFL